MYVSKGFQEGKERGGGRDLLLEKRKRRATTIDRTPLLLAENKSFLFSVLLAFGQSKCFVDSLLSSSSYLVLQKRFADLVENGAGARRRRFGASDASAARRPRRGRRKVGLLLSVGDRSRSGRDVASDSAIPTARTEILKRHSSSLLIDSCSDSIILRMRVVGLSLSFSLSSRTNN